jgi:hypothetical protein
MLGAWRVRWDIRRDDYQVDPGLYAIGEPDADSPVLATANYKLSFDVLRRELRDVGAWLLVLDTRGINVWCAAGKKRFSTSELAGRIAASDLALVVGHSTVIVPQLGATGVAAHEVRATSGFRVVFGPVEARNIPAFLAAGSKATPSMREVTFPIWARIQLAPVELVAMLRPALWIVPLLAGVSVIGPWLLTDYAGLAVAMPGVMATRSVAAALAYLLGALAGAVVAPVLLPWVPVRQFWLKGAIAGGVAGVVLGGLCVLAGATGPLGALGLALMTTSVASWATMNFTGTSTFTSPTGVEAEMRRGIPFQIASGALGLFVWLASAWIGAGR